MGEFKINVGTKLWLLSWNIHLKNRAKIIKIYSKKKKKKKILRLLIAFNPVENLWMLKCDLTANKQTKKMLINVHILPPQNFSNLLYLQFAVSLLLLVHIL